MHNPNEIRSYRDNHRWLGSRADTARRRGWRASLDDLTAQAEHLVAAGFAEVAQARLAIAYGNRPIQFFGSQSRLLIELIEAPDHQHRFWRTV